MEYIKDELPTSIANVLVCIESDKAAYILKNLSSAIQVDVIRSIISMDSINTEILQDVKRILKDKQFFLQHDENITINGVEKAAEIIKLVGPASKQRIIKALKDKVPDISIKIMEQMFKIEDISTLNDSAVQKILREVHSQDLCRSLKGLSIEGQNKIFKNISRRASDMLKEDMEYMGQLDKKIIKEAQKKIISIICCLENLGMIVIEERPSSVVKYGEAIIPKEFIIIFNKLVEELYGNEKAIEFMNNLLSNTPMDDYPVFAEETNNYRFAKEIIRLNDEFIQMVLQEVDICLLSLAMSNACTDVWNIITKNMSKRVAIMLKQEVEYLGIVSSKYIIQAQQNIISIIKRMK